MKEQEVLLREMLLVADHTPIIWVNLPCSGR